MHMSDALIIPAVAGTMYACSTVMTGVSIKKLDLKEDGKKIAMMGVLGAFVFAGQMINFTIPFTGSSGHLCGGFLLASLLGPFGGFLSMVAVLLIQALLFGDGGLLALGCNVWNMAFAGCFLATFLVYKPILKKTFTRRKLMIASIVGSVLSLQAGAFFVTIQTTLSGVSELPFEGFLTVMQLIHLAIGVVEGLITASVLGFVYENNPDLLWLYDKTQEVQVEEKQQKLSKSILLVFSLLTLFFGGLLSQFASANPDGLEWSIEKLAGGEFIGVHSFFHDFATSIQETVAIFPDYGFQNSESLVGTSFSGILGAIVVFVLLSMVGITKHYLRKKKVYE